MSDMTGAIGEWSSLRVALNYSTNSSSIKYRGKTEDLYSLFLSRALGLGWSSTGGHRKAPVLWQMNDAQLIGEDSSKNCCAVFQVQASTDVLTVEVIRPLIVNCMESAERIGLPNVDSVTVDIAPLVPEAPIDFVGSQISQLNWFRGGVPSLPVEVRIDVRACEGSELTPMELESVSAFLDRFDFDPFMISYVEGSLVCLCPEVSPDVIGWLAGTVSIATSIHWPRRSLQITIDLPVLDR